MIHADPNLANFSFLADGRVVVYDFGCVNSVRRPGATSSDARLTGWSTETRFDASDKAIMQCAMAALQANGYRTLTSQPGPRQTALQALPLTIGLSKKRMIVLDALRKQRPLSV